MNWSRGTMAGLAPIDCLVAVVLVAVGIWLLVFGRHHATGVALVVIGAITGGQGAIGYWLRHRHPDPWEPL